MNPTQINNQTDLAALVPGLRRQGQYFIGPCPFCGGHDRFTIKRTDDGDLWLCRKCGDGKYHDAVAFRMKAEGRSFREVVGDTEAQGSRGAGARGSALSPLHPCPPAPLPSSPPDEEWQIARLMAQKEAADQLNDPGDARSRSVYAYLRSERGLSPDTIYRYMLGFQPDWGKTEDGRTVPPGIHIPCMVDGQLWYVKARLPRNARPTNRNKPAPKYMILPGSRPALFNANRLVAASVAVVVEGEFDALLLGQFLPPDWAAVTMGSAAQLPGLEFRGYFAHLKRILLRLDDDDAGRAALAAWRKLFGKAAPLPPFPGEGKDVTEFWRGGGDVGGWVSEASH